MNLSKYGAAIEYTDDLSTFLSDETQEPYRKDLGAQLDETIEQFIAEDILGVTLSFLNTNMHTSFIDVYAAHEHAKLHFPELLI
jgi:hypothetical protein